jgi:hypothetical protein
MKKSSVKRNGEKNICVAHTITSITNTSLRARMQDSDGVFVRHLPAELLREVNVVDTPGTNVILGRQQRLTEEYVPRADLVSCSSLRPMAGCPRVACLLVEDGRRLRMDAAPPPGSAALLAARPADPVLSSHPEPPIPDPASPPMPFPPFLTTTHTHAYPLPHPPTPAGPVCDERRPPLHRERGQVPAVRAPLGQEGRLRGQQGERRRA